MKSLLLIFGAWCFQDGIVSILAYLDEPSCTGKRKQTWKYDHAVRLIRSGIGAALIVMGCKK